jgi:type I restriction enzyme S subunit
MPKGWKMGCLGDLAKGARGVSFSPEKLLQTESADSVILLRSNNIKDGKLNYDEVYFLPMDQVQASQIASQGDLAVCMSNGSKRLVGKAARISNEDAEKKICVGAFCSLFKPTDKAHTEVIPYLFDSDLYKRELYIILAGSAINNLKNSDIEQVPTLIPPIVAQRKIAEILMITDGDIETINHRIEAMRTQKRGLMQKLLTGEVRVAA